MTYARRVIPLLAGIMMSGFAGVSGLVAASEPPKQIHCKATHSISCVGDECKKTAEEHAFIDLLLELPAGDGNLCTSTYCRAIRWLDIAGDSSPKTFDAVRSSASGSTQEKQDRPVVDFYLWVGADRKAFSLIPIDGYGNTWTGDCHKVNTSSDSNTITVE